MINPDNITFPVSLETFLDFQEKAAGRRLSKDEREVATSIVELANTAYFAILGGRPDAVESILTELEDVTGGDSAMQPIITKFHAWIQKAVKQAIGELPDHVAGGPLPN